MIKIRLTYENTTKGAAELKAALLTLKQNYEVLNISKVYCGRGEGKYSNIYVDVAQKK